MTGLSPSSIAHQLVRFLPSRTETTRKSSGLEVTVAVLESGSIDFYIGNLSSTVLHKMKNISFSEQKRTEPVLELIPVCRDSNIVIWLEKLTAAITRKSNQQLLHFYSKKSEKLDSLFPLQYIYGRCDSLLNLGEREGLICLRKEPISDIKWQIAKPFPLKWADSRGHLYLSHPAEKDLLWYICLMMDYLAEEKQDNLLHWIKLAQDISQVWLQFTANCSFCGKVRQQNPELATARLGLIALTQWCLQAILISRLNLTPLKEI